MAAVVVVVVVVASVLAVLAQPAVAALVVVAVLVPEVPVVFAVLVDPYSPSLNIIKLLTLLYTTGGLFFDTFVQAIHFLTRPIFHPLLPNTICNVY